MHIERSLLKNLRAINNQLINKRDQYIVFIFLRVEYYKNTNPHFFYAD